MLPSHSEIKVALHDVARSLSDQAREIVLCENFEKHVWEVAFVLKAGGPDLTVCDLGGGVGINLLVLRRLGVQGRLVLVDQLDEYSEDNRMGSWNRIADRVEEAGIEVHRQNVWKDPVLSIDDDTFSVVTCLDVVEHLPGHPLRQLGELRRVLMHGGTCLISGPNAASLSKRVRVLLGQQPYSPFEAWTRDDYYEHFREYVRREYEELLRLASFTRVDSASSMAVTSCRAKNRYLRRRRSWLSPHSWALFGMAAAEALVPGFRHTVYAWGTKSAGDGIVR